MNDNQHSNAAGILFSEMQFCLIFHFLSTLLYIGHHAAAGWLELYVTDGGFINIGGFMTYWMWCCVFWTFRKSSVRYAETSGTVTPDTLTSYRAWIIAVVTSNDAAFCELSCNLTTLHQFHGLYGVKWHGDSGSLVAQGERYQYDSVPGYDAV